MNKTQIIGLSAVCALTLTGLASSSVNAEMYQEQSQNVSQSSSFSYNCDGSNCGGGSAEFKSSTHVKQSQSQGIGVRDDSWDRNTSRSKQSRRKNRWSADGQVTLSWGHRGGTCHVRYTEGKPSNDIYNHTTWAACDEGEITIGGLRRGSAYTFQVKKDGGDWSSPTTLRAS
jgi:hypothetical protein